MGFTWIITNKKTGEMRIFEWHDTGVFQPDESIVNEIEEYIYHMISYCTFDDSDDSFWRNFERTDFEYEQKEFGIKERW